MMGRSATAWNNLPISGENELTVAGCGAKAGDFLFISVNFRQIKLCLTFWYKFCYHGFIVRRLRRQMGQVGKKRY